MLFAQGDATYGKSHGSNGTAPIDGPTNMDEDAPARAPLPTNKQLYRYVTEFQSHEPEFDYLKSLDIEEKINKIR